MKENGAREGLSERVLSPVGKPIPTVSKIANRLDSLNGKVIGIFDNYKPNADVILHAAMDILKERYGIEKFIYEKNQHSDPITPDQLRRMREADAVLIASAD